MRLSRWARSFESIVLAGLICAAIGWQPALALDLLIDNLRKPVAPVVGMQAEQFQHWQVACPDPAPAVAPADDAKAKPCVMEPRSSAYSGNGPLNRVFGRMIVVPGQAEAVPVFVVEASLGLLLPDGITLQVDTRKPVKLAFRSCHVDGCMAPFRLSSQLGTALRRGGQMKLSVTQLDGTVQHMDVSLVGFAKALEQLEEQAAIAIEIGPWFLGASMKANATTTSEI